MKINLLNTLDQLKTHDKNYSNLGIIEAKLEIHLAEYILNGDLSELTSFIEESYLEAQETIKAIQTRCYPLRLSLVKRIPFYIMAIQKKKLIPRISTQLQEIYGLDEAFSILVNQYSLSLRIAVENHQTLPEISFPEDWPLNKIILARRAILLNLSRMWSKENSDEPIHWRISDALLELAGCSFLTVNEALAKICLEAYSAKQDDLSSFFIKLNSDKTGNILDNLVLSQVTFQSLLDEGWQPDRWEIENLPMSINMFLEFLSLNGFTQVGNIGDILLIDLNNANSNYRYRGSPFLSSNDIKKVQVIVPGWEYMGELIIRQKVIELTVKEGQS